MVIPTYNRSRDVRVAIGTVVAQTYPADEIEIVVVDDGSTDDTAEVLSREFGDRIRYLHKPNGGVSSARNVGMAAARGDYLALLDSDDEWLPEHLAAQIEFLERHPDFGMVLTDVVRMDERRRDFDMLRRREFIREDGHVLRWVLRNPALVPASATFRRSVYEDVGGFDEGLVTGEDLDFHLRIALRWKIGVIEQPLTRAMRGHDGLSARSHTYEDYLTVIERFVARHRELLDRGDRDAALLHAYARNARGMLYRGNVTGALRCLAWSLLRARSAGDARIVGKLGFDLLKGLAVGAGRALRGRETPSGRG